MMKLTMACVGALFLLSAATSAEAKDQPVLTGMALQQIQAKDFETTADILFPAIVTVLQDSGYRINEADRVSGFISGIGSAEQITTFSIWFGLGKKKNVPMVSAFIEQRGPSIARARLNFVMSKAKSRNSFTDEKPVTEPAVYRDAFERIEREVFVRQAMNAPAREPAAATVAAPSMGALRSGAEPASAQPVALPARPESSPGALGQHARCVTCR